MRRESFRIRKLIRKWNRKTGKFHIDIRYKTRTKITPRTIGVAEAFGLGVDEYREHVIYTVHQPPRRNLSSPAPSDTFPLAPVFSHPPN